MISSISGTITHISESKIVLNQGGIGFEMLCPTTNQLTLNQTIQLQTYLHWSQDHGPSLYGFQTNMQKDLFLLIIDTPGIGPKLGISILEQVQETALIEMISQENSSAIHKIKGLGLKKAEVLCMHLKDKASKLLKEHPILTKTTNLGVWNDLQETLQSLSYSTLEIKQATSLLKENIKEQAVPFDLLLRKALTILAKK